MELFNKIINWMKQGSSKAAVVLLAGLAGYTIAPESIDKIVLVMGVLGGVLAFFHKEKGGPDTFGAVDYLKKRLSEKSTQLAIIGLAALGGYTVAPEQLDVIVKALGAITGLLMLFRNDGD